MNNDFICNKDSELIKYVKIKKYLLRRLIFKEKMSVKQVSFLSNLGFPSLINKIFNGKDYNVLLSKVI